MAVSVFEHAWLRALLSDEAGAAIFSAKADLEAMLRIEKALAAAAAECGLIPREAAAAIADAADGLDPDAEALALGTARDGVVAPDLVRQLRNAVGEPHAAHVHFGATSQDIIDTALTLRLKQAMPLLATRLDALISALGVLAASETGTTIRAITRMQEAGTISAAAKIAAWRAPFARAAETLPPLTERLRVIQLGGPLGDRSTLGPEPDVLAAKFGALLGLSDPGVAWHTDRSRIAELGDWAGRLAGALGRFGEDVALMALTGDVRLRSGGGSSSLPHKRNPVTAEALVTLSRFSAAQTGLLHQALVHPTERLAAAWTIEWMALPPLLVATLAGLEHAARLAGDFDFVAAGDRTGA